MTKYSTAHPTNAAAYGTVDIDGLSIFKARLTDQLAYQVKERTVVGVMSY